MTKLKTDAAEAVEYRLCFNPSNTGWAKDTRGSQGTRAGEKASSSVSLRFTDSKTST